MYCGYCNCGMRLMFFVVSAFPLIPFFTGLFSRPPLYYHLCKEANLTKLRRFLNSQHIFCIFVAEIYTRF